MQKFEQEETEITDSQKIHQMDQPRNQLSNIENCNTRIDQSLCCLCYLLFNLLWTELANRGEYFFWAGHATDALLAAA